MGKVWIKTRYSEELKSEVPHSLNFATAAYGFHEMGTEIVPYHELKEIYDWITRDDIVLDYIMPCQDVFKKFGKEVSLPNYPEPLQKFLGRKIWTDTINSISSNETKWSAGYFVKPIKEKAFTGKIIKNLSDLISCGSCYEDFEVICSEPIEIMSEYRCFIYHDNIIDIRPYNFVDTIGYEYNPDVLKYMLNAFLTWEERPVACSLDICVTKDHRTLLVEVNDAYALGCYGLPAITYAKFISARWAEILDRPDQYNFKE